MLPSVPKYKNYKRSYASSFDNNIIDHILEDHLTTSDEVEPLRCENETNESLNFRKQIWDSKRNLHERNRKKMKDEFVCQCSYNYDDMSNSPDFPCTGDVDDITSLKQKLNKSFYVGVMPMS